jgi:hypothetical protein
MPLRSILDIRGNHDTFDSIRGGYHDYYTSYSTRAAANMWAASCDDFLGRAACGAARCAPGAGPCPRSGASGIIAARAWTPGRPTPRRRSVLDRVTVQFLQPQLHHGPAGGRGRECPAALLLGIDVTPSLALRSPANFLGPKGAAVGRELEARLQVGAGAGAARRPPACLPEGCGRGGSSHRRQQPSSRAAAAAPSRRRLCRATPQEARTRLLARNCSADATTIVAYSHHPLSTVAGSDASPGQELMSPLHHAHSGGGGGGKHSRAAHLGQAADKDPASSRGAAEQGAAAQLQQLLLQHDVAAHLNGHLHGGFGRRMHSLLRKPAPSGSSGAGQPQAHLAHLEAADWKHLRRWRLLAVDQGVPTFADLYYSPEPSGARAQALPCRLPSPAGAARQGFRASGPERAHAQGC